MEEEDSSPPSPLPSPTSSPSSPTLFLLKRENVRKKLVKRDEPQILRVRDALEHILVAGAKVRRDDWRRQEFQRYDTDTRRRKRPRPQTSSSSSSSAMISHAEDFRIYGNSNESTSTLTTRKIPMQPRRLESETDHYRQQQQQSDDSEWNVGTEETLNASAFKGLADSHRLSKLYIHIWAQSWNYCFGSVAIFLS